jgi:phosphate transport system substrate-binding protein
MLSRIRAAFGVALCIFTLSHAAPSWAQDVALRSFDGSVALDGTLIAFDGEFYRVDTVYGPLTVSAQGVSCEGPGCPDLENYVAEARFVGARTITDLLLPALIEAFANERGMRLRRDIVSNTTATFVLIRTADETEAARFTLVGTTTNDGFDALLNREADIALALREPSAAERAAALATDLGELTLDRRSRVLGLDALVPIVAPSNPITDLTLPDLAAIYAGEIVNWLDVGGPDAPIVPHLMERDSGLAQAFADRILLPVEMGLRPDIPRHETTRDLAEAVARDPYAIGVTSFSSIGNARALPLSGSCGFVLFATPATLKAEDYPLTAPLYLYTPARRLPQLVREFLAFFEGQTAERIVRRSGFVNQSIARIPVSAQGVRLTNAIAAAGDEVSLVDLQELVVAQQGTVRLSSTFRFAGGATDLDAASRSSVSRLARAIERGEFDGRELVFVGFSDGVGDARLNLGLSRGRAEAVRTAVMREAAAADLNRLRFRVEAFGEAMPMACDDTSWGSAVNRRVEVWLR